MRNESNLHEKIALAIALQHIATADDCLKIIDDPDLLKPPVFDKDGDPLGPTVDQKLRHAVSRVQHRQWKLDDADNAERLLRNLARRLEQEAPGVAASILEGLDEMLTVNRLRSTNAAPALARLHQHIENMMGTVRRVCRNVKRWRNADMALRWTAAGMMEATKGFRRLKAHKQLPVLKAALAAHQSKYVIQQN